jgi:hypothetical protein
VHNPTGEKKTVQVQLVSTDTTGERPQDLVAATASAEVEPNKTVRVRLELNKDLLAPLASSPDKAGPLPAIPLHGGVVFRVFSAKEKATEAPVVLQPVSVYTETERTEVDTGKKVFGLSVSLRKKLGYPLVGGLIPVRVTVRDKNGDTLSPEKLGAPGNILAGELATSTDADADGSQNVNLRLNTESLGEGSIVEVSIDGVLRSSRWPLAGEKLPAAVGVIVPRFIASGIPLKTQVLAGPKKERIQVVFGDQIGHQVKHLPGPRNEGIDVRVGLRGEAVFVTRSLDWTVEFPTQGLSGEKELVVRDANGENLSKAQSVTVDAVPPKVVGLRVVPVPPIVAEPQPPAPPVKAPAKIYYRPGERIKLSASVVAASGIDPEKGVLFYLGERPGLDGKAVLNSQVKKGIKSADLYEAVFDIPATFDRSEIFAGVIVVNRVGLQTIEERPIPIDPTPPIVSVIEMISEKEFLDSMKDGVEYKKDVIKHYHAGEVVRFIATASDPESDIDLARPAQFFLGDPPSADGKPTQTTLAVQKAGVIPGRRTSDGGYVWAADFTLPASIKRETDLKAGVWFVNGAGAIGTQVVTIRVAPVVDPTVGEVRVKVVKSGDEVGQAGIPVRLVDQANKVVAQGVTDTCGKAKFEKVHPGQYLVQAVKPEDGNAHGSRAVVVRGGELTDVSLPLKR